MIIEQTSKHKSIHVFTVDILDNKNLRLVFDTLFKEKQILSRFANRPDLFNK